MMHYTPTQIHELLARSLPHIRNQEVIDYVTDYLVTGKAVRKGYPKPELRAVEGRAYSLAMYATLVHVDGVSFYRAQMQSSFDNLTNILERRAAP
jgi:hypothetical protein